MAWSQNGIDYVCQKYGDSNLCVVSINAGLLFDYTDPDGHSYSNVPGATSDIIWIIVMGMVTQITMINPSRPTIIDPLTELETANGGSVTPTNANELDNHDENSGDQWCYVAPLPCSDYTNQVECEANDCFWYYDGTDIKCHDTVICESIKYLADCERLGCFWYDDGTDIKCHPTVICESIKDLADCERLDCYWYDGGCHSEPQYPCDYWKNPTDCEAHDCYWWNNECRDSLPTCGQLNNPDDCARFNCYWYDGACHSTSQEVPWLLYAGIALAAAAGVAIIVKKWSKK